MIYVAKGILVLLIILLIVYANLKTKKGEAKNIKSKEDKRLRQEMENLTENQVRQEQEQLRQRQEDELKRSLGKKGYWMARLSGKVGISALVCWGIVIILGLGHWISTLTPSIPNLEFPALLATFGVPAGILTMIALFRDD